MKTTQQANLDRRLKNRFISEHPDGFLIRVWVPGGQQVQAFVNYRCGKQQARQQAKRLRLEMIQQHRPELLEPPRKNKKFNHQSTRVHTPFGVPGVTIAVHTREDGYYLYWMGKFGRRAASRSIAKYGYTRAYKIVSAIRAELTSATMPDTPPPVAAVVEHLNERLGPDWTKYAQPHPNHWS